MKKQAESCLRCKGPMEPGFVLDRGEGNRLRQERWLEGAPESSFWKGIQTKNRREIPVTTLRCRQCGLLESYAQA